MRLIVFALVALAVGAVATPASAQPTVTLRESLNIGRPPDSAWIAPFAINDRGDIVGVSDTEEGVSRAFIWTSRTGFELFLQNALAWDINNRGQVVGERCGTTSTTGFLWTGTGGVTDLGPFIARAINDAGVIAGVCVPEGIPCVWRNGLLTPLSTLQADVWDINARGDVVGTVSTPTGDHAYLWTTGGEEVDLGPGVPEGINNVGTVAGSHRPDNTFLAATLWTRKGIVTLASPPGAAQSVNAHGWVLVATGGHPLVWNSKSGSLVVLSPSRGVPFPFDMNAHGDVVGIVDVVGDIQVVLWRVRGKHLNRR
jgi:probable HAF family extracellular repeat protein